MIESPQIAVLALAVARREDRRAFYQVFTGITIPAWEAHDLAKVRLPYLAHVQKHLFLLYTEISRTTRSELPTLAQPWSRNCHTGGGFVNDK